MKSNAMQRFDLLSIFSKGRTFNKFFKQPKRICLLLLLIVFLTVCVANFPFGSGLTGWDNLHPEYNFSLNFKRAFSVWQEKGLGFVGGHGYMATLPHTTIIWILSLFLPTMYLRSIFTLLMLFAGSLGAFFLIKHLLKKEGEKLSCAGALTGGLFYMLNYATVQQFAVQLEAFIVHYAALPWLIFLVLKLFKHWNKKLLVVFALVNFFASTQGFIPPLFIVYLLFIGVISIFYAGFKPSWIKWKRVIILGVVILGVNAYWLLPTARYAFADSQNYLQSFNNILSTQSWIETNDKFGTLKDIAVLRGFPSEFVDSTGENGTVYVFQAWEDHFDKPIVSGIGYGFFGTILVGFIAFAAKKRKGYELVLIAVFGLLFSLLASEMWGLSYISKIIQKLPIFRQAFRAGFTKTSIALALGYSLFLASGVVLIITKADLVLKKNKGLLFTGLVGLFVGLELVFAWPFFQGHLFYKGVKVKVPQAYFELFDNFDLLEADGKVALMPQGDHWGWDTFRWGYTGSGFLWFGLRQPILERAFDVWSQKSENYFWELDYALKSENLRLFENILEKYQIEWVVFDSSFLPFSTGKYPFIIDDIKRLLLSSSKLELVRKLPVVYESREDEILVFKSSLRGKNKEGVAIVEDLPKNISSSEWISEDSAFDEYGSYINADENMDFMFPFGSLFTNRLQKERGFTVSDNGDFWVFETNFSSSGNSRLILPESGSEARISLLDNEEVAEKVLMSESSESARLVLSEASDGRLRVIFPKDWLEKESYDSYNSEAVQPEIKQCGNLGEQGKFEHSEFSLNGRKINRLENTNSSTCFDIFLRNLSHRNGYLVTTETNNISGFPLELVIINGTSQRTDITLPLYDDDRTIDKKKGFSKSYVVLPPLTEDGLGYSLRFSNRSIGRQKTINELGRIEVYPIPYDFLKGIKLVRNDYQLKKTEFLGLDKFEVQKRGPWFYEISFQSSVFSHQLDGRSNTLVLSQSFHPGWVAVKLDTENWKLEALEHVLVNNWANGWELIPQNAEQADSRLQMADSNGDPKPSAIGNKPYAIYIFFWPQILEFIGFGMLLGLIFTLFFTKIKSQ